MSAYFVPDPALDPLIAAASDGGAAALAIEAVAAGRTELFCALVAAALESRDLSPVARARLGAAAEHLADEAPSYELASRLWRHAGTHYELISPSRACECFARAFAYTPENPGDALDQVRSLVRRGGVFVTESGSRWLRALVRDGLLPWVDFQRFEQTIVDAKTPDAQSKLLAELVQLSDGREARERLTAIPAEGRIAQLRALVVDLWGEPPSDAPDGQRLAMVLGVLEELLTPGADRGEVRFARSVYLSQVEGGEIALRAAIGALEDLPGDTRSRALVQAIVDAVDEPLEPGFFARCLDEMQLSETDRSYVSGLVRG